MKKLLSVLLSLVTIVTMLSAAAVSYAGVPKDAKYYKGHYYYIYRTDSSVSWKSAKKYCEKKGGHLATVTSQGENDFIKKMLNDNERCWLGATDEANEGKWKWVTGEKFSYSDWKDGQPDNYKEWSGGEHYLGYWNDKEWNDYANVPYDGDYIYAYACEWDYSIVLSESSIVMNVGESRTVEYTIKGIKTNKKPTWKSSDKNVAKVSSKGKIIAMGIGSCSITCRVGSAEKKVKVIVKPEQVKDFKASKISRNEITFTWKKQKNVDGYRLYVYDKDIEEYTLVKRCDGAFKSTTVKGLKPGRSYKFKIRPYIEVKGERYYGEYSKAIKVKTKK